MFHTPLHYPGVDDVTFQNYLGLFLKSIGYGDISEIRVIFSPFLAHLKDMNVAIKLENPNSKYPVT